jgi:signal transduction histidine kinase
MIDPARVEKRHAPPPVRIENVVADLKDFRPAGGVRLPSLSRDIRIDYTALSFIAPQRIEFRYRLDGYDEAWVNAGTRRQAFYTNLGPGDYSFHVKASSIDGVWPDSDATLLFTIPPVFYQTKWFLAVCALAALAIAYLGYRVRMREVARRIEDRLAARASERERIARDLHDTLLQTIQGSKLAADTALETPGDPMILREEMRRVSSWLGEAVVEASFSLGHLRGINSDSAGASLDAELRRIAEECAIARALKLEFSSTGKAENIQAIIRDEIYCIGCEAIRNAAEHSNGSRLAVKIAYGSDLVIAVRDDGNGIEPLVVDAGREGHFGIRGMRERAWRIGAKLSIASARGSGTEVVLMVPGAILAWSPVPESRVLPRIRSFFGMPERGPPLPF